MAATPRRYFSLIMNRRLVIHFLVPLLDLSGFEQVRGPRGRFYTVPNFSVDHGYGAGERRRNDYVFQTYDVRNVLRLLNPNSMLLQRNYLRRVYYRDGEDPRSISLVDVRALAIALVGRDSYVRESERFRNRNVLAELIDHQLCSSVDTPQQSDESVFAILSVYCHIATDMIPAMPFTVVLSPSSYVCKVSARFHVKGVRRVHAHARQWIDVHAGAGMGL